MAELLADVRRRRHLLDPDKAAKAQRQLHLRLILEAPELPFTDAEMMRTLSGICIVRILRIWSKRFCCRVC